jgi:hypothetical protein
VIQDAPTTAPSLPFPKSDSGWHAVISTREKKTLPWARLEINEATSPVSEDDSWTEILREVEVRNRVRPVPTIAAFLEASGDTQDDLLCEIQERLLVGDRQLASALLQIVNGGSFDPEDRAMALDAVAAARAPWLDDEMLLVISSMLDNRWSVLQYGAISAASELPGAHRRSLISAIRELAREKNVDVHVLSAAQAFLRANGAD